MVEISFGQALFLALGGLVLGIIMLVRGGDWTVESAVYLAERLGMSHLVIGFTIIAFGTSLPELIVGVNANLKGSPGIALGNVLGSNIANILLVCGAAALVAPIVVMSKGITRTTLAMVLITFIFVGLTLYGEITRLTGSAMILLLLGYIYYEYRMVKKGEFVPEEIEEPTFSSKLMAVLFLVFGLIVVTLGAEFMVDSAQLVASMIGIPEAVIALTVIAFGTSLPELSTCLVAMAKRHGDIVLGNLIGSNVFNILMIIGATAIAKPIYQSGFTDQIVNFDIWVTLGVTLIFASLILFYKKINKAIGIIFVTSYVLYIFGIYGFYLIDKMQG